MIASWPHLPECTARVTRPLMVLDVVESVRLMEGDEPEFIDHWRGFVHHAREHVLPGWGGHLRKSLGDGLMLEFPEAVAATQAALALRRAADESNRDCAPERAIRLRIAVHVAQFVADDLDVYGADVNLTARLAQWAAPGDVVVTGTLRDLLPLRARLQLQELGTCELRHVSRPVTAFSVPASLSMDLAPVIVGPHDGGPASSRRVIQGHHRAGSLRSTVTRRTPSST